MIFEFTENTLIIIPFTYKGYRLEQGEKVRFKSLFNTEAGKMPYELYMDEDNKGTSGPDGHYTVTLDTGAKKILPGRYSFSLELVLASGSIVTLKTKNEGIIEIVPSPHTEE